jgi:asparagine synthase (glutamine-hydrolysing)
MCGIAGIVVAKGRVNPAALARMADIQAHRGPDEENLWLDPHGRLGFAHRRLSIIDLSAGGRQPMRHPSGDTVICYNGEIYNYVELGQRLRAEGAMLSSHSDTEVLLEAYRRWGGGFLGELNGMFSFALYDSRRRRLVCARDRYGEKPFLYVATPDFFAFASEYKALLALAEVDGTLDARRMLGFLASGSSGLDDAAETVFPAIRQLLPGECLTLDVETLEPRVERYWTLSPKPRDGASNIAQAAGEFRDLLRDSVRLRLRSDVPVGSCLSGGLDSGSIVCLARERLGSTATYHAFSGRFPGTAADEGPYIEAVARSARATLHEVTPRATDLVQELPSFMWHNELPVSSASQYAQWCVFRTARLNGVIVLLDGQGGDELLGGYEQYFRAYCAEPGVSAAERAAIRARYPAALPTLVQRLKTSLPSGMRRHLARRLGRGSDFSFGVSLDVAPAGDSRHADLTSALREESFHTVLPTLLRYGDRNSMAHSVEVRLPFCDHRLAEFVFALPSSLLMGDAQTKRLLREAMRGILPDVVRTRWNKQGFVPPQDIWLRDGLIDTVEATVEDPDFAARGYWHVPWWRQTVARARAGEWGLASVLWKALVAEAWQQHFVERLRDEAKISVFESAARHARDLRQSLPS